MLINYDPFAEYDRMLEYREKESIAFENGYDSWSDYEQAMKDNQADMAYKAMKEIFD